MNSKVVSSVFAVAALGIPLYDVCAGERVAPWVYLCVGLLVAAQLINVFGNKTHKTSKTMSQVGIIIGREFNERVRKNPSSSPRC